MSDNPPLGIGEPTKCVHVTSLFTQWGPLPCAKPFSRWELGVGLRLGLGLGVAWAHTSPAPRK
jgi:hypothetical protein